MFPNKELLTEGEVSEKLGIGVPTLRNWRARRVGPKFIRLGGNNRGMVRYRVSDIEAYLNLRTIEMDAKSQRQETRTRRRGRRAA